MKVYVLIVDEMLRRNGVIDETSIDRDVLEICSSLDVALDCLNSTGYKHSEAPSYDACSFHRVSDYYQLVYANMSNGTEVVDYAWVEERDVAESIDYIWNDKYECLSKCCGNCDNFINCVGREELDAVCDDFLLSSYASIEYMD